jgi:hypothetical protein
MKSVMPAIGRRMLKYAIPGNRELAGPVLAKAS